MDTRLPLSPHGLRILVLIGLLGLTGMDVHAAEACRVVDVPSGDTIVADCGAGRKEVHLDGVEGPASEALFWSRAKRDLSSQLLGRTVRVEARGFDEQNAIRGAVYLGDIFVNAQVVTQGLGRCRDDGVVRPWCDPAQSQARSDQRGLWSDPWNDAGPALALERARAPAARVAEVPAKVAKASATAGRGRGLLKL